MIWAATLKLEPEEKLEDRVITLVEYLRDTLKVDSWTLRDIETNGTLGTKLSQNIFKQGFDLLHEEEFLELLSLEQVLELEIKTNNTAHFHIGLVKLIIRDGASIDIISSLKIPKKVLGDFEFVTSKYF